MLEERKRAARAEKEAAKAKKAAKPKGCSTTSTLQRTSTLLPDDGAIAGPKRTVKAKPKTAKRAAPVSLHVGTEQDDDDEEEEEEEEDKEEEHDDEDSDEDEQEEPSFREEMTSFIENLPRRCKRQTKLPKRMDM